MAPRRLDWAIFEKNDGEIMAAAPRRKRRVLRAAQVEPVRGRLHHAIVSRLFETLFALMSRRITIVEDEPAIRENYADVLRKHGYEVATFANRPAAMQAFRTQLPSLAIIDV